MGSAIHAYGVVSLPEFERLCATERTEHIVGNLIPEASVSIAVGDSGLGKSAWAYQLGMCVASGVPFLSHPVKQKCVLYIDLENGREGIMGVARSLVKHLGIDHLPEELSLLRDRVDVNALDEIVAACRPALVIVDSLRAYRPEAEDKPKDAAIFLNKLRDIAKKYRTAFLLIHHIKKPGEHGAPALEDTHVLTWLQLACGARALVNQSDVRIGFDNATGIHRSSAELRKVNSAAPEEVALVVKGFARLVGEFGPLYLARQFDDEGNPLGYRQMTGIELLFNQDQQAAFCYLPQRFSFKEAKTQYRRADQPTRDFLQKCIRVGTLRQASRGIYEKISRVSGKQA